MIQRQTQWCVAAGLLAAAALLLCPPAAYAQQPHSFLVNVDSVPQGATVRLDAESGNPLGTTPLVRVRLPRGNHTLFFTRDGYLPGSIAINVTRPREAFSSTLVQAGSIYVSADVDGAQIFLDGNAVGMTPGRINNVLPGQHVVEIRQTGMTPDRETVTVGAGAVASVNATIRPPPPSPPPVGVVHVIVSNPNGQLPTDLAVTFDGTPMTGTPPTVDNAGPGTHIVQISATGFRTVRREVQVTAGQTYALAVDLDAIVVAPTGGNVRVLCPTAGATVYLDGEVISTAQGGPASRDNVPAGTHSIRVSATGRETVTREITVTAGQPTNLELPDLAPIAQVGHLLIRSPTPNANVFIDGRNVGPSPYERNDMPAGSYDVTVRAQGFDDRSSNCVVSVQQGCEVDLPLTHTIGRAALHVELARPTPGAVVLIDGNTLGEIGAGRDIPDLTATTHEIRVRADGFIDYVESVTFAENEQHRTMVMLRRAHSGPTGQQLASRRAAISTWGAAPLSRGDVALDVMAAYGSYPVEIRVATGLVDYGPLGIDAGFSVRSMWTNWELELRSRIGYRALDGMLSVGAELRGFGGIGINGQNNFGANGFLVASLHTLAPMNDDEADVEDPNERGNRLGSFAVSIHVGFEAMADGLNGTTYSQQTGSMPVGERFTACDPQAGATMQAPCGFNPSLAGPMNNTRTVTSGTTTSVVVVHGTQNLVRPIGGVTIEFGASRHVNLFVNVDRVLGDSSNVNQQRAYYETLWGNANDSFTYIRAGLTYKF